MTDTNYVRDQVQTFMNYPNNRIYASTNLFSDMYFPLLTKRAFYSQIFNRGYFDITEYNYQLIIMPGENYPDEVDYAVDDLCK
jgi:hypothetical protein